MDVRAQGNFVSKESSLEHRSAEPKESCSQSSSREAIGAVQCNTTETRFRDESTTHDSLQKGRMCAELKDTIDELKGRIVKKRELNEDTRSLTPAKGARQHEVSLKIAGGFEKAQGDKTAREAASSGLPPQVVSDMRRELRSVVVGQHWDNKISDKLDVLVAANEEKLIEQMRDTHINFFGIDCKSFSRARGRPVPGARSWPCALRS